MLKNEGDGDGAASGVDPGWILRFAIRGYEEVLTDKDVVIPVESILLQQKSIVRRTEKPG